MRAPRAVPEEYLASRLGRFRPWTDPQTGRSPQRDFLRAAGTHRNRVFRAGNQSGKTTIGVIDSLLRLEGWHPFAKHRPPLWGWASALDWEFGVGQILWPRFSEWIFWPHVQSVVWFRQRDPPIAQTVLFRNGSRLDFKSADAGRTKFQGAALHFAWPDEEHPSDIVEEIRARLVRTGGDFFTTLTPLKRERWVESLEREPETITIRASMSAAARAGILDAAAVQAYADVLPEKQRLVRVEGEFARREGLVYPEWSRDTHVASPSRAGQLIGLRGEVLGPWPLPESWPRYASIDFGFSNPTACLVAALDPHTATIYVYRCLYSAGIRASRWGEILAGKGEARAFLPPLRAPLVADHDAMERAELAEKGVRTIAAEKEITPGCEAVERSLRVRADGRPRLFLVLEPEAPPRHPEAGRCDAHFLAWELDDYRYPEKRRPEDADKKDLPFKRDDHACDALRYLVFFLEKQAGGPPRPPALPPRISRAPSGVGLARPYR